MWDDHEIINGYGSLPSFIQESGVLQEIFRIARKYSILFQYHMREDDIFNSSEMIGVGMSNFSFLDPTTCLLGLDCRSERKMDRVISKNNWRLIFKALESRLPATCKHLIVNMGIPIIWPSTEVSEAILELMGISNTKSKFFRSLTRGSLLSKYYSKFQDHPDITEDLLDRWQSERHQKEKKFLVNAFQGLSESRGIRITFISGDTHCCGVGRFFSSWNIGFAAQPEQDSRLMYSITSSAMVNVPPPKFLIYYWHISALVSALFKNKLTEDAIDSLLDDIMEYGKELLKNSINIDIGGGKIEDVKRTKEFTKDFMDMISSYSNLYCLNDAVREEMIDLFETDVHGVVNICKKIMDCRNWCDVESDHNDSLVVRIYY
jgi:hypothetical protein